MPITLIAAMDRKRTIGIDNGMPWRLPAEMAYFKENTIGRTVLMGRKTYESLGKPLPKRSNVVLTRNRDAVFAGCETVHSVDEALDKYGAAELMVIGGAEVYELFLPHADKLLLTEVDADIKGGDAFFPAFPEREWKLVSSKFRERDDHNVYSFTFHVYERL